MRPAPRPQGSNPGGRPGSLCGHLQERRATAPPCGLFRRLRLSFGAQLPATATAGTKRTARGTVTSACARAAASGTRTRPPRRPSKCPPTPSQGQPSPSPTPPKAIAFAAHHLRLVWPVLGTRVNGVAWPSPACARRMQQLCVTPGLPRRARLCPPPPNSPPGGSSLERPPSPASSSPCEVPGPWRWVVVTATGTPPPRRVRLLSPEKLREPGQRLLSPPTGPGGRGAGWPLAWV